MIVLIVTLMDPFKKGPFKGTCFNPILHQSSINPKGSKFKPLRPQSQTLQFVSTVSGLGFLGNGQLFRCYRV